MKANRREFLKYLGSLAGLFGLSKNVSISYAKTIKKIISGDIKILIISGQACSGCFFSATYSDSPFFDDLILMYKNIFHITLAANQGKSCLDMLNKLINEGNYILTVEGSIPEIEEYCKVGNKFYRELFLEVVTNAKFLVNMGTCASFGGIPAAQGNPTKAISIPKFLEKHSIKIPYINVPGCPVKADSILATWLYIATFDKLPPINNQINAPKMFYDSFIHNKCERFRYFVQDIYAKKVGDKYRCLLALGCKGPITYGDCSYRKWNCGKNYCISAGTPCIGCFHPEFPFEEQFYTSPKTVLKGLKI